MQAVEIEAAGGGRARLRAAVPTDLVAAGWRVAREEGRYFLTAEIENFQASKTRRARGDGKGDSGAGVEGIGIVLLQSPGLGLGAILCAQRSPGSSPRPAAGLERMAVVWSSPNCRAA